MQAHPIKPALKPPGSKRLKLECDILLSNFASKFSLRRYSKGKGKGAAGAGGGGAGADAGAGAGDAAGGSGASGGAADAAAALCQPVVAAKAAAPKSGKPQFRFAPKVTPKVGRCRLTLSSPS